MPRTPDRRPGPLIEDEFITLGTESLDPPSTDGQFRYVSGSGFRFQERGFVRTLNPLSNVTSSVAPGIFDGYNKGYEPGSVWVVTGTQQAYVLVDPTSGSATWKNITSASSGISDNDHKTLRQLIHFIEDGGPGDGFYSNPFREIAGGIFPNRVTWWSDSDKTIRLFQTEITRSGIFPVTQTYKMYSAGGVVIASAQDIISYSGAFEVARSRSFA